MEIIPLKALPNQTLTVTLSDQVTQLNVYQKQSGLYVDVLVDGSPIIQGVLGLNLNRIVRSTYLGFDGDLTFIDSQGADDPIYTGLGGRFTLNYLSAAELA